MEALMEKLKSLQPIVFFDLHHNRDYWIVLLAEESFPTLVPTKNIEVIIDYLFSIEHPNSSFLQEVVYAYINRSKIS